MKKIFMIEIFIYTSTLISIFLLMLSGFSLHYFGADAIASNAMVISSLVMWLLSFFLWGFSKRSKFTLVLVCFYWVIIIALIISRWYLWGGF
jgi:hypothetical protein